MVGRLRGKIGRWKIGGRMVKPEDEGMAEDGVEKVKETGGGSKTVVAG